MRIKDTDGENVKVYKINPYKNTSLPLAIGRITINIYIVTRAACLVGATTRRSLATPTGTP